MRDAAHGLVAVVERATTGLAEAVAGAAVGWLLLGVVLHVANQVARGRGWHALVRAACPAEPGPRCRDVIAAWVAGAGAGGVLSARGGDAVRVLLLARRAPDAGCPVLAGTLVAEGAGELAFGAAVPAGQVAAFLVGTSTILTLVGVPLAAALVLRGMDGGAPAAALSAVRAAARPP